VPAADPSIAPPADAGTVIAHAGAVGTQDYACKAATDGGTAWTLVGPDAVLRDCDARTIGQHDASDAGASGPAWQIAGSRVVGRRVAGFSPDGGAPAVPWLLLQAIDRSDAGVLAGTTYVQRVRTTGGTAPAARCSPDAGVAKVPYTADYYFYGSP
jgi:hypothetical protein